ncbi:WD repeat-containing protein 55 [Empidonax traillii]|uniref:WD repeat-containing protein 55 n=1 Tax=Empidonax traillii TaxID=164674 RepID=UPI000FFD14BF|nr:WD repeat-containing protein 55 [Empidonax traillii]
MAAAMEEDSSEEPAAREPRVRDTPEDICFEATANAIALHPERPLLAAGDVDGDVYLYSYSCTEGENRQLWSSGHHLKSCRDVAFSQDGQKLFTVSKDKSIHILTVEEGRLETRFPKAHGSALNCVLPIDQHVFATGDDGGAVKVWDLRKGDAVLEARQQEEYISAMAVDGNGKILLTASGDGTLGVYNVKRRRFELLSEPQNGDLTSVVLLKRGRKVACGSSEGTIYLFNWDGFGAASDRFALRAESIDCMVPITDSIVCVGSLDGVIRSGGVESRGLHQYWGTPPKLGV